MTDFPQDPQDQLQIKQNLLKAEIIDKGYDCRRYLDFCVSKKENGDDLNNWSMEELMVCVQEFQNLIFLEQQQQQQQAKSMPAKALSSLGSFLSQTFSKVTSGSNNAGQQNPPPSQIPQQPGLKFLNSSFPSISPQNIQQKISQDIQNSTLIEAPKPQKREIQCKKLEKNELNDRTITVKVQNPKQSEKSLLLNAYVTYEVVTEEMQWLVHRRYSDFDWLRNSLCKLFPRLFVPPLPGKKMGQRRFEQDFIEKRMKFLQIFIEEVMKNESFKTSEALFAFLSFNDRNQFERKMKEINSVIPSLYCEDQKTLTGSLTVFDDDDNEKYYTNINNYFRLQTQMFSRITFNFRGFYKNINAACDNLEQLYKDLETLGQLNEKVQMKKEVTKTYEELGIFFKNWKRILFNENEIISKKIKDFFKLQKLESVAYTELIDSREVINQKYLEEKKKLNTKKEKLYAAMDMSKWEIIDDFGTIDRALLLRDKNYAMEKMCTRETLSLEGIHKQLGYANEMNIQELKKIINNNLTKFVKVTKEFAAEFYPSLNDSITLWSTLNTYI